MGCLKLDLHEIYNKGEKIEAELQRSFDEALQKRIPELQIIPGKGTGALMNRVKRFLREKAVRRLYHRMEVDENNHGRLFVHFRFKK